VCGRGQHCDQARPNASNLNYTGGVTVANQVITKLPADGTICPYTSATDDLIVDVDGSHSAAASPSG